MSTDRAGTVSLWRSADFLKLWSAQSISLIGTQVTALALPLTALLRLNASPPQAGLLGTAARLGAAAGRGDRHADGSGRRSHDGGDDR